MTIKDVRKNIERLGLQIDRESGNILVEWEKIPFAESDRPYWAALSSIDDVGPSTIPVLVAGFGSAKGTLCASLEDLRSTGVSEKVSERIARMGRNDIALWYQYQLQAMSASLVGSPHADHSSNFRFLVPQDKDFPRSLKQVEHGPSQLWAWGDANLLSNDRIIAIVGTRKMTPYGKEVSTILSSRLASLGCVVVSGLMYGIDETAMRGALFVGGKVIGVWAGGLTRSSFGSRFQLATDVVGGGGVVISEFVPDHFLHKGMFPARNRIVSGLARGVVVAEGAVKSGSLITASQAIEQGKPVGAVPGPITSVVSSGPNELLKLGAIAVTSAEEILTMCEIPVSRIGQKQAHFTAKHPIQRAILSTLKEHALTVDELVRQTNYSIAEIGEHLTDLELLGVLKQNGQLWNLA